MTTRIQIPPLSLLPQPGSEVAPIEKTGIILRAVLWMIGILAIAVLIWAGITSAGSPDPTAPGTTPVVAIMDSAVLVFREGLECVLVLVALTAGMAGSIKSVRNSITLGVIVGLLATVITWMMAVGIVEKLMESIPAMQVQAATGLLAIVVLLVIMNWFFHKVYWGGWIAMHHRRKKALISGNGGKVAVLLGLVALGFTSVYREGFEIVLFLQSYRLKWGSEVVLSGALIGLVLTAGVGVIVFVAQRRLPFRKMLVVTGVLLGFVLLVMVGEQAFEMQQAHWIPATTIPWLVPFLPAWTGVWFSLFPTVETLVAQALAALIVIGSFFAAKGFTGAPRDQGREAGVGQGEQEQ